MENLQRVEPMNELETIKRKIVLNRHEISLIRGEIVEHEERFILLRMRDRFEKQIMGDLDPALSSKLEAIQVLLGD